MPNPNSIFISYRRSDSISATGHIYERLANYFGASAVFRDTHSIQSGEQFPDRIRQALEECEVLIAVIGPNWASVTDTEGKRRLENAKDWVRREIELALAREVPVIPLLVEHAVLPQEDELPDQLKRLTTLQTDKVRSDRDFSNDVTGLIRRLETILEANTPKRTYLPDPMLEALQKQRGALQAQFDAVVEKLTYTDEVEAVRYENQRNSLARRIQKIDQQIRELG